MASATHVLKNYAAADVTFTLASQSARGALYKDTTRALSEPRSLEFDYKIAPVGSLAHDHLIVKVLEANVNGDTGVMAVGSAKLELSIPRDDSWSSTKTKDLLAYIGSLLLVATDNHPDIANAIVP
jgi:hypothetical protein